MPNSPHDALAKHVFSDPEVTAGELASVLPALLLAELDLANLTLRPGSFVDAHSTLGQGCEFVVRLPVMPDVAPEPRAMPQVTMERAGAPLRVLVVDDNEDAASMLGMLVEAWGHRVETVHTGTAALVAAVELRPHVALLDIGLPGMDGYELARRLRQQALLQRLVLVATTGYGRESDRQRTQAAGFDHHLVKPLDLGKLAQILAEVRATPPLE